MRKSLLLLPLIIFAANQVMAQNNTSTPMNFHIEKEVLPPLLEIVEGSIKFSDADDNDVINASEECHIMFQIRNDGKGDAYGCKVNITAEGATDGLVFNSINLPTIKSGEQHDIAIPITSTIETLTGQVRFNVQVDEPNGFGTTPFQLKVNTQRFKAPFVEIVSNRIFSSDGESQLRKRKSFKIQVMLQNTDYGLARNVTCVVDLPEKNSTVFLVDGDRYTQFPTLAPNEKKLLTFEFQTNTNVPDSIVIPFKLSESYGRFAKDTSFLLTFGQPILSDPINLQIAGKQQEEHIDIKRGSLVSDVDMNIPIADTQNDKTFVVIIANENYDQVAPVPFALNDGNSFWNYCTKTLGIPQNRIRYFSDATYSKTVEAINWLRTATERFENPRLILYYAGHGIPDEASKTAYLLPVDCSGRDVSTCYKLDKLYATLGKMHASQITVFLDACFSGSKREDGMLISARGVALDVEPDVPQGNTVVFSAAQGNETAFPDRDKQHGLFTYYLLKKLQETGGNVSLQDLGEYIKTNVSQQSFLNNSKPQTPCIIPSEAVESDWKEWTLK